MGGVLPVLTTFSQAVGAISTISNLLGVTSQESPSYQALPQPTATTEVVETPTVATAAEDVTQKEITSEEEARQRALRRRRLNQSSLTFLNSAEDKASVLTSSLFGE